MNKPLWQLTATQLAAGFGDASFTPTEALQACLSRSAEVNPRLNALITLDGEGAAHAAEQSTARWRAGRALGALDGVPVTIKDNLQVRGLPTHWGSRALAGLLAERDELPVAKLREAGAVIFGKTNVPEFTMQGYTDNAVFGPTGAHARRLVGRGGRAGGRGRMPDRAGDRWRRLDPPARVAHQSRRLQAVARTRAARRWPAADLSRFRGGRADRAQRGRRGRRDAGDRARPGRRGDDAARAHPVHPALR
jgi:hypothetical protein